MQQQLPNNLNYSQVKPIGYPSNVRMEKFIPVAFNTSTSGVQSSDVIRFNISTNGFWDPYSAYIKVEVDASQMDGINDQTNGLGCGTLQIDNSASSLINQLIISQGGTEIERIEEYDTIASILNDMNSSQDNRSSRYFEGMYSQNSLGGYQYSNPSVTASQNSVTLGQHVTIGNYLPTLLSDGGSNTYNNYLCLQGANVMSNRYEWTLQYQDGKNTVTPTNITQQIAQTSASSGNKLQTISLNSTYGYKQPFCQSLSSCGNEATLSHNVYNQTTYKGQLGQYIIGDKITFCIPLISGLLGILVPKESYKYIPMKALQALQLEFRLNPYALFTSGYNDNVQSPASIAVMTAYKQISRLWRITKFEINAEIQYFEPVVENVILSQLGTDKGIVLHSQSWMLGPRYQIAAGTSPSGTYQVNLGFESLKNVVWVYMPDDFLSYTYCRKQYRLSANLTSMYIKIGSEYYPPLPITGHAGNPGTYQSVNSETDYNNSDFLVSLYKAFGKFNDIGNNCIVNNVNFAVNCRAYNPATTTAGATNYDTSYSQPMFHENRCVGRAVYAMNLETLNQDYSVISGINTISNRPFEITLKSDGTSGTAFTRSYTMYVFCNYDMLIQLKTTGIAVLGRG